jgi:hypothetical protein
MEVRVDRSISGASHKKVELTEGGGEKTAVAALISGESTGATVICLDRR